MMKKILLIIIWLLSFTSVKAVDYSDGVFFINEDWYGHNNGTLNFLSSDGTWNYKVFQQENLGNELGATSQYGAIYGDKFYIISKQDKDPGSEIVGSRMAVCDAKTLKILKSFPKIGNGGDARSFVGVNAHKGYISTSNGVWIYDIDNMIIGTMIEGTGNSSSGLYSNQVGTMLRVGNRIFAVHQSKGVFVINANDDTIEKTVAGFYGSIVLSKDGALWLSVAKDASGSGTALDKIVKIDPYTLALTEYELPKGTGIPNSWYAWTADGFCSSKKENKLYWKNAGGWFASKLIYSYDIATNTVAEVVNFTESEWGIYGAGFRLHPTTDEIYCSMYKSMGSADYEVMRINSEGEILQEYPMSSNYWFPAMPVFPDNYAPEISFDDIIISEETVITLDDKIVTDKDNMDAAIVKNVVAVDNEAIVSATILNNSLVLTPHVSNGEVNITIEFNSNGKIVTKNVKTTVQSSLGIDDIISNQVSIYPNPATSNINIKADIGAPISIYGLDGVCVCATIAQQPDTDISVEHLMAGMYIVKVGNVSIKIIKR